MSSQAFSLNCTKRSRMLDLSEESARYFTMSLFTARPELAEIDSYLPGADFTCEQFQNTILDDPVDLIPPKSTYLARASDEQIRETKPKDIARLFQLDYPGKLQLELGEG